MKLYYVYRSFIKEQTEQLVSVHKTEQGAKLAVEALNTMYPRRKYNYMEVIARE